MVTMRSNIREVGTINSGKLTYLAPQKSNGINGRESEKGILLFHSPFTYYLSAISVSLPQFLLMIAY
jgi:hypothetical protein